MTHAAHPLRRTLLSLLAATALASPGLAQPAGVSDFTVQIPRVAGNFGINHVSGFVTFTDNPGSATVRITNGDGVECIFNASVGGSPAFSTFMPNGTSCIGGTAQPINDFATFTAPAPGLPAGDPQGFRYKFDLFPLSNIDSSTPGVCPNTPGSTDSWKIAINTAGLTAASVCLVSFDRSVAGAQCSNAEQEIVSTNPAEVASVLVNGQPATQFCGSLRPATDVMLVLDRSGSMNSNTLGSASRPKFAALRDAVSDFVEEWDALRAREASPPTDNLGLVFFNGDAANPATVPLGSFASTSASVAAAAAAECGGPTNTTCTGSTSIGDGLEVAASQLFSGGGGSNRKAIVLMSDGQQNTPTMVTVDDPVDPSQVLLYETNPNATSPLFGAGQHAAIYSVTVGTSTAVSADLNEDIARATGGYYVNTEDDQEFVRPFFLEGLENVVRFNSWQSLRLASGTIETQAPLDVPFPVSTTTRAMTVNLLWDAGQGGLDAVLLPPGYAETDALTGTPSPGAIRFSVPLPLNPAVTPDGNWILRVRAAGADDNASNTLRRPIPFHVSVIGDDNALHGQLAIAEANYRPGDNILVTAEITNPQRLTKFGASPRVEARILRPGEAIGNVIASSDMPGDPSGDDQGTPADTKLANILDKEPGALQIATNTVPLGDDGTNGDATAGDGIFSGTIRAEAPGHYTALITVEGQSERSGRFSREAVRSVHVRAVPDQVSTDEPVVTTVDSGTQVVLTFRPKTAFGDAMVGFGPYFPVTASGIDPVIPRDNLNGSYTATLTFPGAPPGDVAINWIETSTDLNGVPGTQLPITQQGKVLVTGFQIVPPWRWLLILVVVGLLLVLLLLAFAIRKRFGS